MYDIFYVSDKKTQQFDLLKQKFPLIKLVSSYEQARKRCLTEFFWLVWSDIEVDDSFMFDYVPDNWSREYVHQFLNDKSYDGIVLCPKSRHISKKEIEHRFFVNNKKVEIVASRPKLYEKFQIRSYDDYLIALENSETEMFWGIMRPLIANNEIFNLYFEYNNSYDRNQNHVFLHDINGDKRYDGIYLFSKRNKLTKREIEFKHPVHRKEWDIVASWYKPYDVFEIDSYEQYLEALENTTTEMFWMSSANISAKIPDIFFDDRDERYSYERNITHVFIHQVKDKSLFNGVFLCSTRVKLSRKEIEHRFPVHRKEWDIIASGPRKYNTYCIDTYEEYLQALENSSTEMFWIVPSYVDVSKRFKFDTYFSHDQSYERAINHVFLNGKYHDGVVLCSKHSKFSKREFDYRFISHKKESPSIISLPKPYDIVFISYQEPNADENYKRLLKSHPGAKRIHGVKGIHQAHIEAAKLAETDMLWIVDGDAIVADNFYFDYQVARWDQEIVHVWRSQNPINGLVYGYGGIKLFPRKMTINMDLSKPDMTTSISSKFKAVNEISNITAFNTDPFNTWKSAFRECVKLSSRIIDRQKDEETQNRLQIWCTVGIDQKYGKYAIDGAKMGALYGTRNQQSKEKLKMINNFDWLKEQFNDRNI